MDQADVFRSQPFLPFGERLGGGFGFHFLALLDEWIDEVCLPTFRELRFHEIRDVLLLRLAAKGCDDLSAAGRFLIEQGNIEIAVDGHGESAGDGRGGHDQHVRQGALTDEGRALDDAELVLLIDHHESEIAEKLRIVEQGVGADEDGGAGAFRSFLAAGGGAENEAHAQRLQPFPEGQVVLLGEDLGGSHQCGIRSGVDGEQAWMPSRRRFFPIPHRLAVVGSSGAAGACPR